MHTLEQKQRCEMEGDSPRNELEKRIGQVGSMLRDEDEALMETIQARQAFYEYLMLQGRLD